MTDQESRMDEHANVSGVATAGMNEPVSATSTVSICDGDVFRFRYSDVVRERWRTDPYWCFDGQVVCYKGKLIDTYWGFPPSHSSDGRVVTADEGHLVLVCNLHHVRDIHEHETRHYDAADVFNLTHHAGHHKRFVVRVTATPSAVHMLDAIRVKENQTRREMESAVQSGASTLVRLGELRARLESGDLSKRPWW